MGRELFGAVKIMSTRTALAVVANLVLLTLSAHATDSLYCGGTDEVFGKPNLGALSIDLVYGSGISSVQMMTAAGRRWSSRPDDIARSAEPIYVTDANDSSDAAVITADFSATRNGPVIATLRTFKNTEPQPFATQPQLISGGIFSLKGVGTWTLYCYGP